MLEYPIFYIFSERSTFGTKAMNANGAEIYSRITVCTDNMKTFQTLRSLLNRMLSFVIRDAR